MSQSPPPLIAVAGAPVPPGLAPAWIAGAGGVRLRAALLPAVGPARGSVVINTGRTESLEKYFETAQALAERGFVVLLHDWRGQGLSGRLHADRLRGHAETFDDFLADFQHVLSAYEDRLPRPWLLVGHSMGGALSLLALARGETRFSAAVLTAPMFGIAMSPLNRLASRPLSGLARLAGRAADLVPGQPSESAWVFENNRLTHDRARYERMRDLVLAEPDLALGAPTWGWLRAALIALDWLRRAPQTARISIPVTILSAEQERIVDNHAQTAIAARLPKGRVVVVPGAFHEILQETDERRALFFAEFDALAAAL